MRLRTFVIALCCALPHLAQAEFNVDDDGTSLSISENGKPVLAYHHGWVDPPEGVDAHFRRTGYVHPLYGLDGEVLTQDFPDDHYHHRGVFWGWPNTTWKGKQVSTWSLKGARQSPVSCAKPTFTNDTVTFSGENHWILDEAPDHPIASERYRVVVHAATDISRAIDFTITIKNISDAPITMLGATTDQKGYGGFNLRPDKTRKPMHFTSAMGPHTEDAFDIASPWVDLSYPMAPGSENLSGAAIFQHPANPGYPHEWWIIRHYAFLGHSWPGNTPYEIKPGDEVTLRYRLYTHRGTAKDGKVAEAFANYTQAMKEHAMPDESKVLMFNALWFKPDGGAEKYGEYLAAVGPISKRYGGKKLSAAVPKQALIGKLDADLIFFVEWPNWTVFQKFLADPEFQKVSPLREEAITDSLLIRCDPM
ncbi:MAG: PmoA family protein [Candidatus Hydrogenedentes bacterium]|nr:PmoA family protein [Candidatus Hydrogenedentota bacterium]